MHAQTTGQTPPITVNTQVLNVAFCLSDHAEAETVSKHACRPYTSALLALLLTATYIVFYVHANTLAVFEAEHGGAHSNVVCQQPHDCLHKCLFVQGSGTRPWTSRTRSSCVSKVSVVAPMTTLGRCVQVCSSSLTTLVSQLSVMFTVGVQVSHLVCKCHSA